MKRREFITGRRYSRNVSAGWPDCLLRRPLVLVAFGAFLGLGFLAFTAHNIEAWPDPARTDSKRFVLLGFRQLQFKMFFRTDLSGLPRKPFCPSPPPIFMHVNADKCLLRGT